MVKLGQHTPRGTDGMALDLKAEASRGRFSANEEPRLDDLLDDPIITCLMASDGLHRDAVTAVLRDVQARLQAGA